MLIFDEVMTGFRVAFGGAQALYGIKPDMTTLGKIIGGGLPCGAFGGRAEIMDLLAPLGPVYQAGTLSGNPLAMAAGIATVGELIQRENEIYPQLERVSAAVANGVAAQAKAAGIPVTTNRVGSMFTWFFTRDPSHRLGHRRDFRHSPLRKIPPSHARSRSLAATVAVRSDVFGNGAWRG